MALPCGSLEAATKGLSLEAMQCTSSQQCGKAPSGMTQEGLASAPCPAWHGLRRIALSGMYLEPLLLCQ